MATILNADTVSGGAVVTGDSSGEIQLQGGGTPRLTFNTSGAMGVGSSPSYGTNGQILTSSGNGASPSWSAIPATNLSTGVTGTLPVANGGTGVTTSTGSGNVVLSTSPTLTTPLLGTPTSGNLSNCTVDGTNPVGFRNVPQSGSDKVTSYSLATTDVGKFIGVGSGGSITVPNSTFSSGDIVSIFNNTTGNVTLTMSITTAYIGGTDSDKNTITLATRGVATILFISGTVCVVNGNVT